MLKRLLLILVAGSAGKLREAKDSAFEGGTRVPFIVRWPGHVEGGTTCRVPASLFDLLPTFAEITAAKLPVNVIDGRSMLSLWNGSNSVVTVIFGMRSIFILEMSCRQFGKVNGSCIFRMRTNT